MRRRETIGRILGIALVLVTTVVMFVSLPSIPRDLVFADEVVTFPDPNLEAVIREAINKPTGTIYDLDLEEVISLSAYNRNIIDLTGLEHCNNLTWLSLESNQISDISPLANLTSLTGLYLSHNRISDISPLANLTSLPRLTLDHNQISNIPPLSNLISLGFLGLCGNQISDISPLSGLPNLTFLDLQDNQISMISLTNVPDLDTLWLCGNQISDITALANLTNLKDLSLCDNPISDLSPLSTLTSLAWLYCGWNQVSDVSALSSLANLTFLVLTMNQISDISPLSSLTNLNYLELGYNPISDLSPLSTLTSLTGLSLHSISSITDISPLSNLTGLTDLSITGAEVSDISPLTGLTSLVRLDLNFNQITDISAIGGLINLQGLRLAWNQISNITALANLTNLGYPPSSIALDLRGNQVSDIEPLVNNPGLSTGDVVDLGDNPLSSPSIHTYIPQLQARGVFVYYEAIVASKTEAVTNGTIDAREEADTEVEVTGNAAVTVAQFASNPRGYSPTGFNSLDKYIDVWVPYVDEVIEIEIRLYYTDTEVAAAGIDEESLRLFWWDGDEWVQCSYSGVNTASTDGYSGYMWAIITENTTPSLENLQGTPFSGYGLPSGGCFVATAIYGTPVAAEVQTLRTFRDEYLLASPLGQAFVNLYYQISPPIAEFITQHPGLKPIVRAALVPAIAMSTVAVNATPDEKAAVLVLLVLIPLAAAMCETRRRCKRPEHTQG